jgi:hypothetical protein
VSSTSPTQLVVLVVLFMPLTRVPELHCPVHVLEGGGAQLARITVQSGCTMHPGLWEPSGVAPAIVVGVLENAHLGKRILVAETLGKLILFTGSNIVVCCLWL